ncbi:hypothetical protein BCR43DRAFT_61010 [Syncephalastrum racemosum]|uniref:F-box domain-containing protein n=1 Tax=Syncephalastrum racemosum TaxID=13706 RepID=A0A1X2HW38_SYNRA|nr:hypothetical protein BCR43DRAFT_61010 [Syncephalastrum racemosum]
MVSPLGTLCQLPNELIHRILSLINNKDLVVFGRLNSTCAEAMLPILTERVRSVMGKDGWRVYVDIISDFTSEGEALTGYEQQEACVLGHFDYIDPTSLDLVFAARPYDAESTNEIKIPGTLRQPGHIEVLLYCVEIQQATNRLLSLNQVGGLTITTDTLQTREQPDELNQLRMSSDFVSLYYLRRQNAVQFKSLRITPEWWICQLENPYELLLQDMFVNQSIW